MRAHHRRDRRRRRGMRFGQPYMQRHHAGLGAESEQGQQKRRTGPARCQRRRAHRLEGHVPAATLQHAETQQQRQRADVRHQQVQEAGAADLRQPVLRGHQEVRTERHGFPRHHEQVGVVGQDHHRHAGDEHVVLQTQQARRRALAGAEITGGEDRNAGPCAAQQQQEECRQRVQAHVERQVGQPQRQYGALRGAPVQQHQPTDAGDTQRNQGAQRKQRARDPAHALGAGHAQHAHQQPGGDQGQQGRQKRMRHHSAHSGGVPGMVLVRIGVRAKNMIIVLSFKLLLV